MKKTPAAPASSGMIEYLPCVLKLEKRKFVCYVEKYVNRARSLQLPGNAVKVFSTRKKAWRAAVAMAGGRHKPGGGRRPA